jgi:hypothetical protein
MTDNGLGLGEGGVFTTNVDAENETFCYHKTVCEAMSRQFLVDTVISRFHFSGLIK